MMENVNELKPNVFYVERRYHSPNIEGVKVEVRDGGYKTAYITINEFTYIIKVKSTLDLILEYDDEIGTIMNNLHDSGNLESEVLKLYLDSVL